MADGWRISTRLWCVIGSTTFIDTREARSVAYNRTDLIVTLLSTQTALIVCQLIYRLSIVLPLFAFDTSKTAV